MRTRSKFMLAGLGAAVALSMAVTSASAGRLSLSNRTFRIAWSEFTLQNGTMAETLRCPLTMEGSFHSSTIRKVEDARIGHVSRGTVQPLRCSAGTLTVEQESLPWRFDYVGFSGTLPRITQFLVTLIGAKFRAQRGGISCTFQTEEVNPTGIQIVLESTTGLVTSVSSDSNYVIPMRGNFPCNFSGNGRLSHFTTGITQLGSTGVISVKLI